LISVRVGAGEGVNEQFPSDLGTALGATLLSADVVGPSIGADLRTGAIYAILVSLALILLYTAWRVWPNWPVGLGASLASVHDVLLVMGILILTGAEFSIPVLAALLFVVGYSLNDSI